MDLRPSIRENVQRIDSKDRVSVWTIVTLLWYTSCVVSRDVSVVFPWQKKALYCTVLWACWSYEAWSPALSTRSHCFLCSLFHLNTTVNSPTAAAYSWTLSLVVEEDCCTAVTDPTPALRGSKSSTGPSVRPSFCQSVLHQMTTFPLALTPCKRIWRWTSEGTQAEIWEMRRLWKDRICPAMTDIWCFAFGPVAGENIFFKAIKNPFQVAPLILL